MSYLYMNNQLMGVTEEFYAEDSPAVASFNTLRGVLIREERIDISNDEVWANKVYKGTPVARMIGLTDGVLNFKLITESR